MPILTLWLQAFTPIQSGDSCPSCSTCHLGKSPTAIKGHSPRVAASQVGIPLHGWVPMLQRALTAQSIPPDLNLLGQRFPQQHGARRRQIWVPFRYVKLQCGFGGEFSSRVSDTLPAKDEIALWKFRLEISRKISRDLSREISHPNLASKTRLQNSSPKFVSKTRLQNSSPKFVSLKGILGVSLQMFWIQKLWHRRLSVAMQLFPRSGLAPQETRDWTV